MGRKTEEGRESVDAGHLGPERRSTERGGAERSGGMRRKSEEIAEKESREANAGIASTELE